MFQKGWFNHQLERNSMRLSFRSPITGPGPQKKVVLGVVVLIFFGRGREGEENTGSNHSNLGE